MEKTSNNQQQNQRQKFLEAYNKRFNLVDPKDEVQIMEEEDIDNNSSLRSENLEDQVPLFQEDQQKIKTEKQTDQVKINSKDKEMDIEYESKEETSYRLKSQKFWCHGCSKEFSKIRTGDSSEVTCPYCQNNFTEEIQNDYHPKEFLAQVNQQNSQQQQQQQILQQQQQQRQPQRRISQQNYQNQPNNQGLFQGFQNMPRNNNFQQNFRSVQTITRTLPNGQVVTQTITSNQPNGGFNNQIPQISSNFQQNFNNNQVPQQQQSLFNNFGNQNMQNMNQQGQFQQNQQNFFDDDFFGQPFNQSFNFNFFGNSNPFNNQNPNEIPQAFRNLRFMPMNLFDILRQRQEGQGPPPAQQNEIQKLKTFTVNEEQVNELKDNPCAICQEEYKCKEKATKLPCGHTYHEDCVKKWLEMHNSCPVCRKAI